MLCPNCGAHIDDREKFCIICGKKIPRINPHKEKHESAFLSGFVSLFIPLFGFILFFLFRGTKDYSAKVCLRNAFIGLGIYLLIGLLFFLFWLFIIVGILT